MQHSKKALLVTIVFVAVIFLLSAPFIALFMNSSSFTDREIRKELAGELDYLIVGASHGLTSLKPSIIDEHLSCNSYNLCGFYMTCNGREALLNEEIARNDLKTVVIEISYDTLTRPTRSTEGDMNTLPRLGSFSKKLQYFLQNVNVGDWDYLYHYYFLWGSSIFSQNLKGSKPAPNVTDKGYIPQPVSNLTLSSDEIQSKNQSLLLDTTENPDNLAAIERMVNALRAKNVQVYFVVTPVSDAYVWEVGNWNTFETSLSDFSKLLNVQALDFNLLKNRNELFSDDISFSDRKHMSDEGATVFSQEYCKIMNMLNSGESIDELFYDSYAEMKAASPYNNP